ncbi:MAG: glycoside hydrolase family 13 protein [Bacteroidota bacterium]|nr:glycoside hydrolase family 13 protein [Bacteroidota bacterium]
MKKSYFIIVMFLSMFFQGISQNIEVDRVEPPFWWVGMNNSVLQILVHGDNISATVPKINYHGVSLQQSVKLESPNYLFLYVDISENALVGTVDISFEKDDKEVLSVPYELKDRRENSANRVGFNETDIIYLLMPDRFSNGDESNDSMEEMKEKADRSNPNGRHGGDIQGIINHIDYFNELGVTALWLNPFLENNQKNYSYHGYAISDFYKVDSRMGTNRLFKECVEVAHQNNLKVIQDMIFNHFGISHWWMNDLPSQDWIHQTPEFNRSNYRAGTVVDPHVSEYDKLKMSNGWFDHIMPDLNQKNPFLATYLIQNSIWWIEFADLDGIRMDTQPYPDKEFMADWARLVREEYPNFSLVGEAWIDKPSMVSYYQGGKKNHDGYDSYLTHVFDFPGYYAISKAFNEKNGWTEGIARLYENLSADFLYPRPNDLIVFADNHDLTRFYTSINEDFDKYKMAMTYVFTTRGLPMLYYGTEFLMTGFEHQGHGFIREDFPGGWKNDKVNVFSRKGLAENQIKALNFTSKLIKYRAASKVLQQGKLTQFIPEDGVYVYFRHNDDGAVMVIFNNNNEKKKLSLDRFGEILKGFSSAKEIISAKEIKSLKKISLKPKSSIILELKK